MNTDEEYKKAFSTWVETQKNTIKQVEYNIENSKRMIEVHSEALEIFEKSLKYEKELLKTQVKLYKEDNELK